MDAAFRGDRERFLAELADNLKAGWGDFAGTVTAGPQRAPQEVWERVPAAYVMQPARVKLTYRRKPFMSIDLETRRLFAFRASHAWPPTVVAGEGWQARYADAAEGLDVLALEAAIEWANEYIASL